ncbi:conserved hypothetical protein [delta proteobacterium NaphS2]|nr:conserved hypothetical protein [delta proteobacterium NaphS2]
MPAPSNNKDQVAFFNAFYIIFFRYVKVNTLLHAGKIALGPLCI